MAIEWVGPDFEKKIRKKREGRKHGKKIGDAAEIVVWHFFKDKGFLAIRVPAPRKRDNRYFQQKHDFAKWDILVIQKGIVVQVKRRKKYMSKGDTIILKKSCKKFPHTELTPELAWIDRGPRFKNL